jgi:hypothetical protein
MIKEKQFFVLRLNKQLTHFMELIKLTDESTNGMLRLQYHSKLRSRFFNFVKINRVKVQSFDQLNKEDQATYHSNYVERMRSSEFYKKQMTESTFKVQNQTLVDELKWNPFFFEEIYEKESLHNDIGMYMTHNPLINRFNLNCNDRLKNLYITKLLRQRKSHLVILCHGYQGKRVDMRILENYFVKIFPHTIFLVSEFNQNMENKRIEDLGRELAREVDTFVSAFTNYSKISFVGHSLGGIIIRTALPYLKKLRPYMCSYVSLSVPHLGCRGSGNMLVQLGMNLLVSIKKDFIIKQLQMDDHEDIRQTFMYKLSTNDCLHWFQNILLVSSPQDSFVPYFSARIQPNIKKDNDENQALREMAYKIWSKVSNNEITRFDVDINSPKKYKKGFFN